MRASGCSLSSLSILLATVSYAFTSNLISLLSLDKACPYLSLVVTLHDGYLPNRTWLYPFGQVSPPWLVSISFLPLQTLFELPSALTTPLCLALYRRR